MKNEIKRLREKCLQERLERQMKYRAMVEINYETVPDEQLTQKELNGNAMLECHQIADDIRSAFGSISGKVDVVIVGSAGIGEAQVKFDFA